MKIEKEIYTVEEIAEKLSISRRSAYTFCKETSEFHVCRVGKLLRINKQSFDEWFSK